MKIQQSDVNSEKLRGKLKRLFKTENPITNGKSNNKCHTLKQNIKPQMLGQDKSYSNACNEEVTFKKKKKLTSLPKKSNMKDIKLSAGIKERSKKFKPAEARTNMKTSPSKKKSNEKFCENPMKSNKNGKFTKATKPTTEYQSARQNETKAIFPFKHRNENSQDNFLEQDDFSSNVSSDEDAYEYESYTEDYSTESDDYCCDEHYTDFDSSGSENLFNCDPDGFYESDPDYELPPNVSEDLIIHNGTAKKHELLDEHNVSFDSEDNEPQIIELATENENKEIKQPEAYSKGELINLSQFFVSSKNIQGKNNIEMDCQNENKCPLLVPITDADGFQMYTSENDCSSCEDFSDSSSMSEDDINQKYITYEKVYDNDYGNNKRVRNKPKFNVGVIDVRNYIPQQTIGVRKNIIVSDEMDTDGVLSEHLNDKKVYSNINNDTVIAVNICETNGLQDALEEIATNGNKELTVHSDFQMNIENIYSDLSTELNDVENCETDTFEKAINNGQEQTPESLFINAINSNLVLVLLKEPFYLYGTVCVTLLAGNVEIYGYLPPLNKELEVFSPRGCCSIDISPISTSTTFEDIQIKETLKPLLKSFSSHDLKRIEKTFESGDALLLLKRNNRRIKLKNIFRKYMNENIFPNMNSIQTDRPLYASEYLLDCVLNKETERPLLIPKEWRDLCLTPKSKVLLAGGKSVGKSTLLRYLVNCHFKNCERVLVVDLDIGQAELFLPQTVSCTVLTDPLLGPGFFLNHPPTRAYAVGHSNVVLCAQSYMSAVKRLIEFCLSNKEFAEMPWLINTMGYNKGFGLELMSIITQLVKPTDVVQLQSNKDINNFDMLLHPHQLSRIPRAIYMEPELKEQNSKLSTIEYRLHVMSSAILQTSPYLRDWEMSAKDLRYATFLSRLSEVLQGNAEWLSDCCPFRASIENLHLVNMISNESTREELIHALEANLVFLCRCENGENPGPIECFGIGIARAIDIDKLYLLPAMTYDKLNEVNCLALGEMPLPSSLFTNQGPRVRKMAAFLYNTIDARTSKSIKQIYHRPSQFLSGTHKQVLQDK